MIKKYLPLVVLVFALAMTVGCVSANKQIMASDESQVKLRNMQSRVFDTGDKELVLRTALATLQDLGFIINKADMDLGSVSATKLNGYSLRMTVTAVNKGEEQMVVRANAQYNIRAVEDPMPYQQFFDAYSKALFLEAHEIN